LSKLEEALELHRRGERAQAERLYREILSNAPSDFDALQLLGVIEAQKGDHEAAVELMTRALAINPGHAASHGNRGTSLRALKRYDEALACFERELALEPDDAEALYNRGATLHDLGAFEDAVASYDLSLTLQPGAAATHYKRGTALLSLERFDAALASYDRALTLQPNHAGVLNNRGYALYRLRRFEEALASYDRALRATPKFAAALNNRGNVLQELRRFDAALESYRAALAIRPDDADALNNCGNALRATKRHEAAADCYARLLAMKPHYDLAKGKLLFSRMTCCDWREFAALAEAVEHDLLAGRNCILPFAYQAISDSAPAQRRCAEIYAAATLPATGAISPRREPYRHDRIRVGYVCGELRQHATSQLMVELFERHDRQRFQVLAFDTGWKDGSELRRRVERAFDEVIDIAGMDDAAAAAAIARREIDILVDLNGYCGIGRQGVFWRRPCPVQVSYLGFTGTLGTRYMDYVLADAHVIPPGHEAFYTEEIIYLPDSYFPFDRTRMPAPLATGRAAAGLPDTGFVFCCFNNNYKITPAVFEVWMRLLGQLPGSVLWLLEDNPAASRNLRAEAGRRGIPADRLVFAERLPYEAHLARHVLADLFLDTLPRNAHTTAVDALWAGLPVLTCTGNTFAGRVAGSLLHAVGLPELVTGSLEDYPRLALELATTPAMLSELRIRLAMNRETWPLFDSDRFRRNVEAAFVTAWERNQRGEAPQSFAVPA